MKAKQEEGKIELILGPMFSGKSTRLIEIIRKSVYQAKKSIIVNPFVNKRYSEKSEVVTHDLIKYDSIDCKQLSDYFDILKKYDVIGIDEGQSFPDLIDICEELAFLKKTVIVAALNGGFRMKPFPVISRLISKCDKIKLLKAYCFHCHKDSKFTFLFALCNENVLNESREIYKPACRECHAFFSKEREKGNFNINKIKSKENEENKEIKISLKIKDEKEFNSSSTDTSFSQNKKIN